MFVSVFFCFASFCLLVQQTVVSKNKAATDSASPSRDGTRNFRPVWLKNKQERKATCPFVRLVGWFVVVGCFVACALSLRFCLPLPLLFPLWLFLPFTGYQFRIVFVCLFDWFRVVRGFVWLIDHSHHLHHRPSPPLSQHPLHLTT